MIEETGRKEQWRALGGKTECNLTERRRNGTIITF